MARTFDGTGDNVTVASTSASWASGLTVAAIVRRAVSTAWHGVYYGNFSATALNFEINDSNSLFFQTNGAGVTSTGTLLAVDGWALVAVTKATGALSTPVSYIYTYGSGSLQSGNMSGVSDDPSTGTGVTAYLGAYTPGNSDNMNGQIAAVGLWNTVLSSQQVQALAFSLSAWYHPNLLHLWVLDQGDTAIPVLDRAGNGGNQTALVGTTVSTVSVPSFNRGAPLIIATRTAAAGGTNATASPAVCALSLTSSAVSLQAGSTPAPAVASLVLAQPAATLSAGSTAAPAVATLNLSPQAVALSAGATASPSVATLILDPKAVTASGAGAGTASPSTVALILAPQTATPSASSTTSPAVATLVLTPRSVTVAASSTASPNAVAIPLTPQNVTLSAGTTVSPATVTAVLTPQTVTAGVGATASPAAATLVLSPKTVTLTASSTASPAIAQLVVTIPAVSASGAGTPATDPFPVTLTIVDQGHTVTIHATGHTVSVVDRGSHTTTNRERS